MSRRRRAEVRPTEPDPKYHDLEIARFINRLMHRGKKTTAQRVIYDAMDIVQEESRLDPREVFRQALKNATPVVEVRPRRVGGATYQVPTELRPTRSESLAMRWLIQGARGHKGLPMRRGLAMELLEASRGEGSAVRRRDEMHRMAEANRAFVHYRI